VVRISDPALGRTYYLIVLFIFLFSFVPVIKDKRYLEYEKPSGAVQFSIVQPNTTLDSTKFPYCLNENDEESNVVEHHDHHDHHTDRFKYTTKKLCAFFDDVEILHNIDTRTVLVSTSITDIEDQYVCQIPKGKVFCQGKGNWEEVKKTEFYALGVEDDILEIRHSMAARLFYEESHFDSHYAKSVDEMTGVLIAGTVGKKSKIVRHFQKGEPDRVKLGELLSAAGFDQCLDSSSIENEQKSIREAGIKLELDLAYHNARCDGRIHCAFGVVDPTYRYRVHIIPDTDFSLVEVLDRTETKTEDANGVVTVTRTRITRKHSGVLLGVEIGGRIGRSSFHALMVSLGSTLGWITLATIFVDYFFLYFPNRRRDWFTKIKLLNPPSPTPDGESSHNTQQKEHVY